LLSKLFLSFRAILWREIGENCIMRSFISCTQRQT
jgi:hypothetical protein